MSIHVRLARWAEEHPHLSNAVLMGLATVLSLIIVPAGGTDNGITLWSTILVALPLPFRRAAPVATAFAVGALALTVLLVFNVATISLCMWAVPCLVYTVAVRSTRVQRRSVLAAALLGCVVLGLSSNRWFLVFLGDYAFVEYVVTIIIVTVLTALFVLVAFLAGDLARTRLRRRAQLEDRARRLEVEREQEVRIAAQDERTRIAREMHDVVAHSLSVVIAQADGGRYAAASNPAAAAEALETISETARDSLTEMRKLLGVLRTTGETETKPVPQLGDVPDLVRSVEAAGLPVQYTETGTASLNPGAQLSLYRTVQEGLTNVLKHAWQANTVRVNVEHHPGFSWVEIVNDGAGTRDGPRAPGGGHGLQGLRERVALYGGDLTAGPHPTRPDVFVVQATFPTDIPTEDA